MDVAICLLAAETEDVQPLRWHDLTDCLTDSVHDGLQV